MAEQIQDQAFFIPKIKDFVPEKMKPWIMIAFVIIIQFSGGIYLAAANQMVGSTQLMQEDITMAGQAGLAGLALFFSIMFRMEMAVPPKTTMLLCGTVIIIANVICMYTTSVPVLVATCFVAGFFRMWATLECNSTIQLWITPMRNMSVWFCYICLLVNVMIEMSGILTLYMNLFASWRYMHLVIIVLMLLLIVAVMVIYQNKTLMPRLPLYGIDWIGLCMWAAIVLSALFVLNYGEHYDWFSSWQIQLGTLICVGFFIINRIRARVLRHPYISPETFKYKIVWIVVGLYLTADTLLAPQHVIEPMLTEGMMNYDEMHVIRLNWIAVAAVAAASIFSYKTFAQRNWTYHRMTVCSFLCYAFYLAFMYFRVNLSMSFGDLAIAVFSKTFGYVIMAIILLTVICRMPFPDRFTQGLCIQNIFSASIASAFGTALIGRIFNVCKAHNTMIASMAINTTHPDITQADIPQLIGLVQQKALIVTSKEIYGVLLIMCIICLVILAVRRSNITAIGEIHPLFISIRTQLIHQINTRMKFRIKHKYETEMQEKQRTEEQNK